jgi:peptidoglycan/LPS O-acetylase OafA/YrhL
MYLLHIAWLAPAQMLVRDWGVLAGSAAAMAGLLLSCWALHVWVEEPARTLGRAWAARMLPPRSATQDA